MPGPSETSNSRPPHSLAAMEKISTTVADRSIPNDQLYDEWAATYDTDGNALQAVDDLQMLHMVPDLIASRPPMNDSPGVNQRNLPLRILDLGCGTGRNTLKLLQANLGADALIEAWDASQGMLGVAQEKCQTFLASQSNHKITLSFHHVDFADVSQLPEERTGYFDLILSTLVLEHLPARSFFSLISKLLTPQGRALVTNMHPDMGMLTRAGLKNEKGERVKGVSHIHGIEYSIEAAKDEGLMVVNSVNEVAITADMIQDGRVGKRGNKWIGTKVWYGMILQKMKA